ncbi:GNAT family N-acetyltransferase [Caloramator sp. E03]|uniref:GNAT family N-acetyltransferase n=1 Tax=Caloramator sp. E03 TaxID=2576307 RepID=UPI001FAAC1AE|nr:GNAT family N-acetyltransferase [Caloramator sp. E03]
MKTININLINGYKIKSLCIDEYKIVEELCKKCSDYYLLVEGVLPDKKDIDEIFMVLPPSKNYEDKYVLGIFGHDNKLAGIVDIVKDFPTISEWMLGLLLIEPDERGKELGKIVHKALSNPR